MDDRPDSFLVAIANALSIKREPQRPTLKEQITFYVGSAIGLGLAEAILSATRREPLTVFFNHFLPTLPAIAIMFFVTYWLKCARWKRWQKTQETGTR